VTECVSDGGDDIDRKRNIILAIHVANCDFIEDGGAWVTITTTSDAGSIGCNDYIVAA
jgi:hypothetical protein